MLSIFEIINEFSSEEKKEFDQFLAKKTRRGDAKNRQLLKLLEKGKTQNLDLQLYGKPSRNAFHALSKRLQDNLIEFVAIRGFSGETSEEMDVLKLLLASRIFFEHGQSKFAFKTLNRAEKMATQLDAYSILNEIYHTKIQYAHLSKHLVLDRIMAQAHQNMTWVQQEQQLNMAYATIKQQLQSDRNLSATTILEGVFDQYELEVNNSLTFKSLFQLFTIITSAAKEQGDYYTILSFAESIFEMVKTKRHSGKHLYYHIEILHLMSETYFRNKNFEKSLEFLEQMEIAMQSKNGRYFKRFEERLVILKAMNLNYSGDQNKAIEILESFKKNSFNKDLTLIMCWFQQGEFSKAYDVIKFASHSDSWYEKKDGWIWVLKKNMMEILLLIELDKLDLVLIRLRSFKRKYYARLRKQGEDRVINFMKLITYIYDHPDEVTSEVFKERVENSFEWIGSQREDIFVMSFYAWLKAKMESKDLYTTTLDLVSR